VLWTITVGLCAVAIAAAFVPHRGPAISPVSTWAALAAVALAFWASIPPDTRFPWPWRRSQAVRSTVSFALLLVGLGLVLLGHGRSVLVPIAFTLLFVSDVVDPETSRRLLIVDGVLAVLWWLWR
jgi:hypothetical protein